MKFITVTDKNKFDHNKELTKLRCRYCYKGCYLYVLAFFSATLLAFTWQSFQKDLYVYVRYKQFLQINVHVLCSYCRLLRLNHYTVFSRFSLDVRLKLCTCWLFLLFSRFLGLNSYELTKPK